jgi:hypothetical protein
MKTRRRRLLREREKVQCEGTRQLGGAKQGVQGADLRDCWRSTWIPRAVPDRHVVS